MDAENARDRVAIVWLEDGDEVPFEQAELRRPWLEESAAWHTDERDAESSRGGRDARGGGERGLVWI